MTFADKLRELKGDTTEATLAKAAGVPLGTLHKYLLGHRSPTLVAAVKLARALGVAVDEFAGCDDIGGRPRKKKSRPGGPA